MSKLKIIKGIALVNFFALLTIFLMYRNGSFDSFIHSGTKNSLASPNGGTLTKSTKDSSVKKNDSLKKQRLSSSKSLVLVDNMKFNNDTIKAHSDSIVIKSSEEEKRLMYSSKSGIIIESKMFLSDSLNQKKKSKKKRNK